MLSFRRAAFWFGIAGLASAQTASFEGQPAIVISNGRITATVLEQGATLASVVLPSDPGAPDPLWNPIRLARENGRPVEFNGSFGHFVCVDGFGPTSPSEKAAGVPGHGEAHLLHFGANRVGVNRKDAGASLEMKATLPIVQEAFTRTFHLVPGENVIYVDSRLENLLGFDRPVNWAEHATVSAPFVEPGKTFIEISGSRSQNRPYSGSGPGRGNGPPRTQRRLVSGADFTWPFAPALDGSTVDMRTFPDKPHFLDHATTLLDPSRETEFAVAFDNARHLVYGYLFRRADYPWIQHWGNYPSVAELVRGMEFGTQPYDVPRHDAISMGTMFGAPTFRWLPAKGAIESHFLLFYSRTPEQMGKIDDVRLEDRSIVIEDRTHNQRLVLAASRGLDEKP
jgi:hypothetical protein